MELNNTLSALDIMRVATSYLNGINYDRSAYWHDELTAIKIALYNLIEQIETDLNKSQDDE